MVLACCELFKFRFHFGSSNVVVATRAQLTPVTIRGLMASLPPATALRSEIERLFQKVLNYDFESKHSWEPRVSLFGSRASRTESAWSDFDFIVEVPEDYSHFNHIYRQLFRVRLVTFDRDLRRAVTTKSSSKIE